MRRVTGLLIATLVAGMVGCAPRTPKTAVPELAGGTFVDAQTGEAVPFDRVVEDLLQAHVIYFGERHDRAEDHALQEVLLRTIHEHDPSLAVGMEMFQRPFQEALDSWVAGRIDAETLRERTEYERRWGVDFDYYAPILEFARRHGLPVVALKPDRTITRTVAHGGLDALKPDVRERLPELDLESERHRRLVMKALEGHPGMKEAQREHFYVAQVIWDEVMAQTIAQRLSDEHAPRRMLVLAGRTHVRSGLGIPQRAARRGAVPYRIVLPVDADERALRDAGSDKGSPPADYLWVPGTGSTSLTHAGHQGSN